MRRLFYVMLLLGLSSCVFRKTYHRPPVCIPETWRIEANEASTLTNLNWWEQFGDPVLNQLIFLALKNNNDLKVAIARVDEYYGRLGVVSSELYPQITADGFKQRTQLPLDTVPPTPSEFRRFNTYQALLFASFEVDIWGRLHSASDAALAELLAQVETRRTVVLTLVTSVASSYVHLLQFDKQRKISIATAKTRQESERIAKVRYDEGLTSELEYKQAQSETLSAIIAIKQLEILIAEEENLISLLIGQAPDNIPRGVALDGLRRPPCIPTGLPGDLLNRRPDILEAEEILSATFSRIGEAKAAFFPDLTLTGFYGNQSSKLHNLFTSKALTWQYQFDLFQQVFSGFRLESQLYIAYAQNREALFTYFQTILFALKEVNDALISHKVEVELIEIQSQQVSVLEDYRRLANLQYDNGQIDYLTYLDSERRLFEAQLNFARVQSESFLSIIELYKALGGGWVIDADNQALWSDIKTDSR